MRRSHMDRGKAHVLGGPRMGWGDTTKGGGGGGHQMVVSKGLK